MQLPVWYAQGLRFSCTQCGNCCTGPPGFVWITKKEIRKLAEHLQITPGEVVEQYCRKTMGRFSLKEKRNPAHGGYDCIFMREQPAPHSDGKTISQPLRTCGIYPVRPTQCRTFPFWTTNLASQKRWEETAQRCPGIGQGPVVPLKQIETARRAPTSEK
jgi:uncharacterized protein